MESSAQSPSVGVPVRRKLRWLRAASVILAGAAPGLATLVQVAQVARGADDKAIIEPEEKWANVFGGRPVDFHFAVKTPKAFTGRAEWHLNVADVRKIASDKKEIKARPDQPAKLAIRLPVPPVKDGVIQGAKLHVAIFADGKEKPEAVLVKLLWIFPENPFADRSRWLKDLKIVLFDPEKKTAEVFKQTNVPFEQRPNVAGLGEIKEGTLIVGEGVSFKQFPDLPETLTRAAAGGVNVLCLAPADGTLTIPGVDVKAPAPTSLVWKRQTIIQEFDDRLDAQDWSGGKPVGSSIAVQALEGRVVGVVSRNAAGWPWLEARFAPAKGKLVICGFGMIERWQASPTPRFLLARLLETLTAKDEGALEREGR
jgi:hypothetical protein